jgi:hypothetical protein
MKSVNASITVTRDGLSTSYPMKGLGYATFVALQAALTSALGALQAWGAMRVAAMIEQPSTAAGPAGNVDLKFELAADHGVGTSGVILSYTGLDAKNADEVTAILLGAAKTVVKI